MQPQKEFHPIFAVHTGHLPERGLGTRQGTIQVLLQHTYSCTFSDPPTHYVSIYTVLNVSKYCHFLNPPSPFADVIYGWSKNHNGGVETKPRF